MINLNAIPRKEIYYIREEGDVYRIIPSLGFTYMKIINCTAKKILDLIDGNKSLGEILNSMIEMYSNVQPEEITNDLMNTIIDFYGAKIILIEIAKGEQINMDKDIIYNDKDMNVEIVHFSEIDFNLINTFIKDKSNKSINNETFDSLHCDIVLRSQLFSYSGEFYGLMKGDMLKAIVSFNKRVTKFGDYYCNGMIVYNEDYSNYELKIFIKEVSNHLFHTSVFNCKKVRFSYIEVDNCFLTEILEQIGYESILKDNKHLIGEFSEFIFDYVDIA